MHYQDIFNQRTINIFCDGSIITNPITGESIGSPGCCVVGIDPNTNNEFIIEAPSLILRNCTNNMTENRSLLLAVYRAIDYYRMGYDVNIFGDSQYCIFGITKWIFSWVKNIYNGAMYNSSGNPVKNEEFIKEIVSTIYYSGLKVNLYHQKGHVTSSRASQEKAKKCFCTSNDIRIVDDLLIQRISYYNDIVDLTTKEILNQYSSTPEYNIQYPSELNLPALFDISQLDMNIYAEQIKRRKRYV